MPTTIPAQSVVAAFQRVCSVLIANQKYLLQLDQAVGDGDLGITLAKIAEALQQYTASTARNDLGKFLAGAGMEANRAGSSSLGTLFATALMRAGKEVRGLSEFTPENLVAILNAADQGIQERGKAQLGDKTIVDALHPAALAFSDAIKAGEDLQAAGEKMLAAAEAGLNQVTPLRSRIGRASWVGDRAVGQIDPGCAALVLILEAIITI